MTANELLERYKAGQRDFRGLNLMGIDLSHSVLCGANFSFCNLRNAWMKQANLRGANLRNTTISRGVLAYADLSGADLSHADLDTCAFFGANLTGANFHKALMGHQPCLSGANLTNVDFTQTFIGLPGGLDNLSVFGATLCNTKFPNGRTWTIKS